MSDRPSSPEPCAAASGVPASASGRPRAASVWAWPHGEATTVPFDGLSAFRAHVLDLLRGASCGRQDMVISDPDYEGWPLGDAAAVDAFNDWALASRHTHCTVLASDFGSWTRQFGRWMRWRTSWTHRIRCLQAPQELARDVPRALLLPGRAAVEVADAVAWRGVVTREATRLARLQDRIDAISQRSGDGLAPTLLGL